MSYVRMQFGAALSLALSITGCSEPDVRDFIWPTSGTVEPQRLSSSFGPRVRGSRSDTYDWHRGIDVPVPPGSPIYAAAAGKVKRAGDDPSYADRIVQIEHCDDDGCFYTNYVHLTAVAVSIGEQVEQGDLIALSGYGESGFPHLHFEIRDGRPEQDHCVHPLHMLPTPSWLAPQVAIGTVQGDGPGEVSVDVTIEIPGLFPTLKRVEIVTADRATGATLEERVFDVDEWNQEFTSLDGPDEADDPNHKYIHVDPAMFNVDTPVYSLRLRFGDLKGNDASDDFHVTVRASDVHGNESVATYP